MMLFLSSEMQVLAFFDQSDENLVWILKNASINLFGSNDIPNL